MIFLYNRSSVIMLFMHQHVLIQLDISQHVEKSTTGQTNGAQERLHPPYKEVEDPVSNAGWISVKLSH